MTRIFLLQTDWKRARQNETGVITLFFSVVALSLIAVIIVIVVCCLKKKYRYYLSNTFWEPGSLLRTSKYHETYPWTILGRYPSKIWWGRWRTKYKEQELKAGIGPHYILKKKFNLKVEITKSATKEMKERHSRQFLL